MKYIDIHTHQESPEADIAIISADSPCKIALQGSNLYALGIHPWHIGSNWESELAKVEAQLAKQQVVAVGECGLDRSISTPVDVQKEVFRKQIDLSEAYQLPMIIHSVRTHSDLLQLRKEKASMPWIIHAYRGKEQQTQQLVAQGFCFSFGKYLFSDAEVTEQLLRSIPLEQLFLETDDDDISIRAVYEKASQILGLEATDLQQIIYNNFIRIFTQNEQLA